MIKATLEFDLSDVDDSERFDEMKDASKMASVIWELGKILKNLQKFGTEEEKEILIDNLRNQYYEMLSNYHIDKYGY